MTRNKNQDLNLDLLALVPDSYREELEQFIFDHWTDLAAFAYGSYVNV